MNNIITRGFGYNQTIVTRGYGFIGVFIGEIIDLVSYIALVFNLKSKVD